MSEVPASKIIIKTITVMRMIIMIAIIQNIMVIIKHKNGLIIKTLFASSFLTQMLLFARQMLTPKIT